ncbi:P1 family peptidase [Botrimarina sp.]|uniref:P1 family peptidase n=1 Tax=Botrimarina sp. TaxID=2795802 RepID=UPI0032EF399E
MLSRRPFFTPVLLAISFVASGAAAHAAERPRAREIGVRVGGEATGPHNAITDVPGVLVGHATVVHGERVRTGVTAVVPHGGDLFQQKVPAAVAVANGFGKLVGVTQVDELGQLETPILLTNTLNVWEGAAVLVERTLAAPGNEAVRSVNPVVGETNDGYLSDIRSRPLRTEHFHAALDAARGGPVEEGAVGAGTGTVTMGYKGGVGTSSRRVAAGDQRFTVGVLVQTNFGGRLTIAGVAVPSGLSGDERSAVDAAGEDGSCMIVVATDAPLGARQLRRLARRCFVGMARAGASFSHGSGDYAIAFSTAESARIPADGPLTRRGPHFADGGLSPLFTAAADATQEAIYNALLKAHTVTGRDGHVAEAVPIAKLRRLLAERSANGAAEAPAAAD